MNVKGGKKKSMKYAILVLVIFLAFTGYCWAESDIKIGYVDIAQAFDQYSKTQMLTQDLRSKVEKKKEDLDRRKAEVERLKQEMESQEALWSEEQKEEKQELLREKRDELKTYASSANQYLRREEDKLTRQLLDEIREIIKIVAQKEGYSIVLEKGPILYSNEKNDLTAKVINQLNKETTPPSQ